MKPRPKLRAIVKRVGIMVMSSLAVIFVMSGWISIAFFGDTVWVGKGMLKWEFGSRATTPVFGFDINVWPGWNSDFLLAADQNRAGIGVPLWFLFVLAAIPTGLCWMLDLKERRLVGSCMKCKYDRRGLAPDATCPECGLVPSAPGS